MAQEDTKRIRLTETIAFPEWYGSFREGDEFEVVEETTNWKEARGVPRFYVMGRGPRPQKVGILDSEAELIS